MRTIILRHDFDWQKGLDDEMHLIFDIERKYNVKSTNFLRYDRGVADIKYKEFYQKMESEGWEFGLHLANHENRQEYPHPQFELETLKNLGLNIYGVSACGGTYNWWDSNGYIVQDNLGLKYICPSTIKVPDGYEMKSIIAPVHVTLDGGYLWKYGESGLEKCISDFTQFIFKYNALVLLSHTNWFYNDYVRKVHPFDKINNTEYYELFIRHFSELPDYQFMTYKQYLNL